MGKFDKKEICEYCEDKMEAKYRNKRFCSTKCRVYWNRENVKFPAQETRQENVTKISKVVTNASLDNCPYPSGIERAIWIAENKNK
jgi:hypothetical protein